MPPPLWAFLADQKIGIVRAGDMATLDPSIFTPTPTASAMMGSSI
jgi:hypothetical protein